MTPATHTQTFLLEAEDLLGQIEETVLEIHPGEPPGEAIHTLFRAFHTIKGSGAMFGFDSVAAFTHHVETVLDQVRDGAVAISQDLVNLMLASKDQIKALLDAAAQSTAEPLGGEKIVTALNALLPGKACPVEPGAKSQSPADLRQTGVPKTFHIYFQPNPGLMASGVSPLCLLDELRSLGESSVVARTSEIPALVQLQPDQCYFAWEVTLTTTRESNAIRDVFIFVEDGSKLSIEPAQPLTPADGDPAHVPANEAAGAHGAAATSPASTPAVNLESPRAAATRKPSAKDSTTRVPSERLDRLVSLVGEMVINQSRLTQVAAAADLPNLTAPVEELERLVAELRDNVLGIRMTPIGPTFNRFKRLVHDLSAELHKEIDLVTAGDDTELDKTVLDQLGDPLVHLIRNSIDHGIEAAELRTSAGKAPRGTIRLAAEHTGSNVVITIQDDGHGLDADAIRDKAIEKHLIAPEATLSREEIFNLIFLPGFSTARQVTSVSGRGVGMDVVRRQIDMLRGSIQLSSELGKGTTVSLTLPLTLAIIEGLLVEVGPDQFIIPMTAVAENVELPRADRARNNGRNLLTVRGELVPYLRLREDFGIVGEELAVEKVVIVRQGSDRVGLVVDRVLGSHQTVIQSLSRFYRSVEVVSGATIMGDGRVALILDVAGVIRLAGQYATRRGCALPVPDTQSVGTKTTMAAASLRAPAAQPAGKVIEMDQANASDRDSTHDKELTHS